MILKSYLYLGTVAPVTVIPVFIWRKAMRNCVKFLALCLFAFSSNSSAQDGFYANDYVGMQLSTVPMDLAVRNIENNLASNSNSETSSYTPQSTTSLTYTPSPSRTRANLQNFVNKSRKADPQGAAELEKTFASNDVIGIMGAEMAKVGLDKNNTADAFAVYWINAWQVAHGDSSTPSRSMARAVAAQAARGMSTSPEFAAATNAQKQEASEALMVQAMLVASAMEQMAGNPSQMKALANAVRQGAKASGLDLDAMTLTEQGFVKATGKKRSDATEALPGGQQSGADGTQLASASAAKGGTDEGSGSGLLPGVLIAGLAGSTLAAAFLYGKNKGAKKGNG
jgi:hypothetical protein